MRFIHFPSRSPERGSILFTTMILGGVAAVGAIWMISALNAHQKLNQRRQDLERAYFAAEAGVKQVINWGNHIEDYDTSTTANLFYHVDVGTSRTFPNIASALAANTTISLNPAKFAKLNSKYTNASFPAGHPVAQVQSILLERAFATDPVKCMFKIHSVGITPSGVRREVLAYMNPNPLSTTEIVLPAGIISMASTGMGGNGKVHWGEAWSKDTFAMLNKSQVGYLDASTGSYDPWAKYRAEGILSFPNTWKSGIGNDIYQETTRRFPGQAPASGSFANGLEQLIPAGVLQWPDLASQYQNFKEQAMIHDRYYTTDAAGNIYHGSVKNAAHKVDFSTEFGEADRVNTPYDLVFIDTIDGTPPRTDGSNLASIVNSGTGVGMKGVFWIGANFTQTGAGNPASLTCEKPDGTTQAVGKVYLDGVLYSAGWMNLGGNPVIYGSCVAQKGYVSGGTPDVYYNYKLANGLEIPKANIGSVFKVSLQKNQGPSS